MIASGGASGPADFVTLLVRTAADAGLAASIFHFAETTVGEVKVGLAEAGIPVRPADPAPVRAR